MSEDNRDEAERLADLGAAMDTENGYSREDFFLEAQARATLAAADAMRRCASALEAFMEASCSPTCTLMAGHPGPHRTVNYHATN